MITGERCGDLGCLSVYLKVLDGGGFFRSFIELRRGTIVDAFARFDRAECFAETRSI